MTWWPQTGDECFFVHHNKTHRVYRVIVVSVWGIDTKVARVKQPRSKRDWTWQVRVDHLFRAHQEATEFVRRLAVLERLAPTQLPPGTLIGRGGDGILGA